MKQVLFFSIVISLFFSSCSSQKMTTNRQIHFSNKVIAHRGAWKNTKLPENSIAALKAAIALGCGGAEFDIHMTSDEVIVINHDPEFLGIPIETSTYKQLLAKTLSNGETIPTLEAYLKTGLLQSNTKLVAEIKTSKISKERSLNLTRKVVEMVKKLNAQNQVVYIAFSYDVCRKIKELDPQAPVQYLNGDVSAEKLKADGLDADYNYNVFLKDKNWIKHARSIGVVTNAWTVNDGKMMEHFLEQQIDFITTNEPELLLEKLKN